jgi:uracil-DNA glycosylase
MDNKRINVPNDWYAKLKHYIESEEFTKVASYVRERRKYSAVYPPSNEIFRAFQLTPYRDVRVVIIGMDPYPNEYREKPVACGLSFAPRDREYVPPSLKQIYNRIREDFYQDELTFPVDLDIEYWAKQGVLMLNAALTVEQGKPGSHMKLWENWTNEVIKSLDEYSSGVVFCLWGKDAQAFESKIGSHHLVLKAEHPVAASYQGRTWKCDHFEKINAHLMGVNAYSIDWIKLTK